MATAAPAPRRVFIHVGVPKSGTSFIQAALRRNRGALLEQGLLFPSERRGEMFHAALDVNGTHAMWGLEREQVAGTWQALCARAHTFDGTTVISSEFFCATPAEQISEALRALEGLEVHAIVTARDMARQIPAEWQEGIKHGRRVTFAEFQARILDPEREHSHARRFWNHQDLPAVLDRWGGALGDRRIHLVTCPRPGAAPELLWERFCSVIGADASSTVLPDNAANASLGITEIEVLRQVNNHFPHADDPQLYGRLVKQFFARSLLRKHSSPRAQTPAHLLPHLRDLAEQWREAIDAREYDVVGDVAELEPVVDDAGDDPDAVPPEQALQVAASSIADLLREVHALRMERAALQQQLAERQRVRQRVTARVTRRVPARVASRLRHLRSR